MAGTLTAANAVLTLSAPGVFSAPQVIQGFAADDVFDLGQMDNLQTAMGVDGKFSAGFVFKETEMNITLQADSDSVDFFETLAAAQQKAHEVFKLQGTISLPAVGRTYSLQNGYLKAYSPMPAVKKILQPRKFSIVWGSITVSKD